MTDPGADSRLFDRLTRELLEQGMSVRFQARGGSMSPVIRDGEIVRVTPVIVSKLRKDDIVLTKSHNGFRLHRLVLADLDSDTFITRGDCGQENDAPVRGNQILGIAQAKELRVGTKVVLAKFKGLQGLILRGASRGQSLIQKALDARTPDSRSKSRKETNTLLTILTLLAVLLAASGSKAQVTVDASTSLGAEVTGPGTTTGTLTHTTTATANRLLLVGASLNITNSTTAKISALTYNGTAMTLLGAHNDAGNTRRVEIWYLLNPASGTNLPISISINVPATATVGVTVGATTFTGVDQTVPLSAFASGDGAASANSQLDVSSVINGMIFDTLATGGNRTVTVPGPQVSQWNQTTTNRFGASSDPPDVAGTGSTRTGAPSVPISETFSGNSNWSLGAVSINPTRADIGVSTTVNSAVFLGANATYTITVTNNGPSAANNVILKDTWAAANLTLGPITPSAGTTCAGTAPITCTLPTPFASGAIATVAVTVSASAAGAYANTAVVSDSGTPPDPNTGNNTYTSVATVQSIACGTTSQATAGTNLSGVLNTYYPGSASVAAGAKSIPVGTATGAGSAMAAGSLLLVIQMQDASINDSNSVAYGNGYTGQGFTALNSAENYEYVTATGAVSGGSVPISGAGSGGGLVFAYHSSAWSATAGQSTYQVIVVPQYTTASLSATTPPTALAWNGSTGGVLVLDSSSTLTLNNATISVDGMGFRGGAGMQLTGAAGTIADYLRTAPGAYAGTAIAGTDAPKGEGIAGTPLWVQSGNTFLKTSTGYPSGTAGTDGSMARGAPGNAGGGGTDGNPPANDQNAGGGGGSNGGGGGFGGDSWNSNLSVGGEGGVPFPANINRIAMGGGGGAGSRNNSDGDNQASAGAAGGGIIIIRANTLSGTATLTANGSSAYNGTANDSGGGGGAGGTIVLLSANGGENGVSVQVNGGKGGDAWDAQAYSLGNRHGPGGGGGGGVVLISGSPASVQAGGGLNGTTLNPGVAYGATAGTAGIQATASINQTSGTLSGAQCTPDMTIGKSHVGNFTRGQSASYTLAVENLSPYGASSGTVTINDTLPTGLIPASATGTGWGCGIASQTVSCVRSDSLAGNNSFYPSITVNANVSQSAPAAVSNTAIVAGGSEINLVNDSATDIANVISVADLAVTNTGSPNPVAAGSNITYTQVVTNNGPSAADNATLVATVPANTTFVSIVSPSGWSCIAPNVGSTGNVVCTNVQLAGSTAAVFTLVTKVNAGTANGTVITETASVSSSTSDPVSTNNSASVSTVVGSTAGAELTVTNVASPNPVLAGSNITYSQVVTNTGSAAATVASFSETTPANTSFVSVTPPAGWICTGFPAVPCSNPSVAAGSSGTFTVVFKVTAGTASGTIITDTATVNATNQAFGANSTSATDVVASAAQADLALKTVATPAIVFSGNNIDYTQTITNNGPGTASTVSFTEAMPANTTFASVAIPAGWSCTTPAVGATGTVNCTSATLASGSSANIIISVNIASNIAAGTITANSSVTSATSDPTAANNSTTVATPVTTACDLTVTNSGVPNPVAAGSNITYTQTVTNGGPSNCSSATFSETTPANTAFVSVSVVNTGGGSWTCPNSAPVSCTNANVPLGSTGTITAIYKVNAGTATGTIISDIASAATPTRDTNLNDNSAAVNITVASGTQTDLSLTNVGSPNPVTAGNNITYTQIVTNGGPGTASAVILTEGIPANTTFVSLAGPAGWTCTSVTPYTCSIATLPTGSATITFVVKVGSTVGSGATITDSATVSTTSVDPNLANNTATSSVTVGDSADLSITSAPSPVPVQAGNNITYTQLVANAGPSAASSVVLTETLPANTTAQSLTGPAGWTCTLATLTCTNTALGAGGNGTFTYVVKVNAGTAAGTAVNETATVSSSTGDANSANNNVVANDVVATAAQADLVTINIVSPVLVLAGSNLTYTQSVTNKGPLAAATATFNQTTPPNTTFQSISIPAGWSCPTLPPAGGTGNLSCTTASMAVNVVANFTMVLQVNPGTPSRTTIPETATAGATNLVPNLTGNSATANSMVADANSADIAIVKTASPPSQVDSGGVLTYILTITNNGPNPATNVMVADTLPSGVTWSGQSSSQGTCSQAGGTISCNLGTIANGGTATVDIVTIAGSPGQVTNNASVTADQTDPDTSNNSASQTETIIATTMIHLQSFTAQKGVSKNGAVVTLLTWKTGGESHNLGFNIYGEENGSRVRLNSSLIAGSALMMRGFQPKHAARTYNWIDTSSSAGKGEYWLEDVDVKGTRTMHGPVSIRSTDPAVPADGTSSNSRMLSQISQAQVRPSPIQSHIVESLPFGNATRAQRLKQFDLAGRRAVKILIEHEGWYRVTQPDLVNAGLDPNVDPAFLRLYAEAIEQPIQISSARMGPGGFGPQSSISFYGTGIDTLYSGTRVYWLVADEGQSARVHQLASSSGPNVPPQNFPYAVELKQRTTYFSAFLTQNGNNFFGDIVSSTPIDQVLQVTHFDTSASSPAHLEVVLQGVIAGFLHNVTVALNGTTLGEIAFTGQEKGSSRFDVPPGLLSEGPNIVTLTSQNGDDDINLVDHVRLVYPHLYVADSDELKFSGRAGDEVSVTGFAATPAAVLDITDPNRSVELTPEISSANGKYAVSVQIPWSTTAPSNPTRHTLLAVATDRIATPAGLRSNHPSLWHGAQLGADIAMITHADFAPSLAPLVTAHQAEAKSSAVIFIDDLYDEFNFGEHSPFAIRQFLRSANANWKTPPKYLLLNGRASMDPRNYLGFGQLDLVPTKIEPSSSLETASDDWFSDFNDTGMPSIATGRLPVATVDDATTVTGKIAAYESAATNGPWTAQAMMVADRDDTESFSQDAQTVQSLLPSTMTATDVLTGTVGGSAARQAIIDGINSGQSLVNYLGHGSEEQWSGENILDTSAVASLTNSSQLPVFLIMDCLNGFFQDVYQQPLGVTLLLAPNGGGVAVLASSGLNQPGPQTTLAGSIVQNMFGSAKSTIGDSILKAKSQITDPDVRKTYILFGDPAMQVKQPTAGTARSAAH